MTSDNRIARVRDLVAEVEADPRRVISLPHHDLLIVAVALSKLDWLRNVGVQSLADARNQIGPEWMDAIGAPREALRDGNCVSGPEGERCRTCYYCVDITDLEPEFACRRFPPTIVMKAPRDLRIGPRVDSFETLVALDHWCGEWRERPT